MNAVLTAGEFFRHLKRENSSVRLLRKSFADNDALMSGHFAKMELRRGLSVHYSDLVNHCDLETESELEPHLSIKLLMAGGVDAAVGGRSFSQPFSSERRADKLPIGVILAQREREIFHRRAHKGERVAKFNISIQPEWLADSGIVADGGARAIDLFCREHLACATWKPSAGALALAERAMRPAEAEPYLQRLHVESCVLPIVAEAFQQLTGCSDLPGHSRSLSRREQQNLARAEELIVSTTGCLPSVEEMATAAGVSVNTLQRLFQAAHGMTVFHYIRMMKLKAAQKAMIDDGLTISQAAFVAGYTSAANFSTAFKRQFGYPPGAIRNRRRMA